MKFEDLLSAEAEAHYIALLSPSKKTILKAVDKTLSYMTTNLRHPSLNTHEFHGMNGPEGEKVFESYVQNRTPGTYRLFWCYGPGKGKLTVLAITPHP